MGTGSQALPPAESLQHASPHPTVADPDAQKISDSVQWDGAVIPAISLGLDFSWFKSCEARRHLNAQDHGSPATMTGDFAAHFSGRPSVGSACFSISGLPGAEWGLLSGQVRSRRVR